ncbi:hypothetical protein TBLA_0F00830 [Henningerozyma blattae CBS 6284]|uniref:ribose-phosphate diphosphokinase n=1 Tax=Henningerozyma blattae (strain ATCC 34711 / CBS 6284 / DSM 70876 / NBRC 10599 / NRRL Y-10934 / UCD 77-7) TaxID=1071380 RepID=I2H5H5_HENB6|nr:hypothetical protein TBLA_0F00830 [Tetrapisispora blattae CBS 6284]CCH61627.1 hypothetical protein TBLA_0F00830 [Tetrapisispora blattae CBS 6284]
MGDIVVFGGSSHPELVNMICENLGVPSSRVDLSKFSNGETNVQIGESVREKDVYLIQSGCGHVNDNFMELLIMISACKSASASRITAVMPYFCYSRQPDIPFTSKGAPLITKANKNSNIEGDILSPAPSALMTQRPGSMSPFKVADEEVRTSTNQTLKKSVSASRIPIVSSKKDPKGTEANEAFNAQNAGYKLWVAQSGTLIANLLTAAGADHVITMDLHDPQFPGFFNIPVDNLYCRPLVQNYIQHHIPDYKDAVIVSPDAGGAKRATAIADSLELSFALIHKERRSQLLKGPPDATLTSGGGLNVSTTPLISNLNSTEITNSPSKYIQTTMLVGDVRNKVCIIVDDLVDTSYTVTRAAKLLKDQGASKVYAIVTHGIFSGDALARIAQSEIDQFVISNTVPQDETISALGKDKVGIMDVSRVIGEAIRRIHNGESISMLFEHGW